MRKLAVGLALATTALASPAFARDDSWYVGVEGGGMIVEDINYDINIVNGPEQATVNHGLGWDVGGNLGYDFGGFRVEAEVSYRSATVDSYQSNTATPGFTSGSDATSAPNPG